MLKNKLNNNQITIGSWITLGHPAVAEILAKAGFDWLVIDLEHSTISIEQAEKANEVFISNSLIGIQSVSSIGSYYLNNNPLTKEIKAAYISTTQDIKSWTCL